MYLLEVPVDAGKIPVDSFSKVIKFLLIVLSILSRGLDVQLQRF